MSKPTKRMLRLLSYVRAANDGELWNDPAPYYTECAPGGIKPWSVATVRALLNNGLVKLVREKGYNSDEPYWCGAYGTFFLNLTDEGRKVAPKELVSW